MVFEQLNGIRERLPHAKAVHKWRSIARNEYVTYKAEPEGLVVRQINPAYTSQRCSKCGFLPTRTIVHTNNGQDEFGCLEVRVMFTRLQRGEEYRPEVFPRPAKV